MKKTRKMNLVRFKMIVEIYYIGIRERIKIDPQGIRNAKVKVVCN